MDIQNFIEKIEQEFDDLPAGALKPDSAFKEVLNWNSINSVVLSVMIEFEYKVLLSADDFKRLTSVRELAGFVEEKMRA
jgi:acyl carrier protein